jgi:phosphatidylinositol 4-kinase
MSSTHSLASIKAHHTYPGSLAVYFEKAYGGSSDAPQFKRALDNFVGSMAAYSVICYLLGIRGRSDANMFLDPAGHIVHSDFSSVFSAPAVSTPLFMQDAPFPLSADMVAVMHGRFSPAFATYARLCGACLVEARKHLSVVKTILEIYDAQTIISGAKLLSLGEFESRHIPATPDSAGKFSFALYPSLLLFFPSAFPNPPPRRLNLNENSDPYCG